VKPFRLNDPRQLLAVGLGAGLLTRMPGTMGTLASVPAVVLMMHLPLAGQLLTIVLAFAFGCWVCDATARAIGVHDHPAIVWDELVGLMITCLAAPPSWPVVVAAFFIFRFFDILKPWPIRWLDKYVHGGIGIMIDDALAGLFAAALLQLLLAAGLLGAY
jgi:phosphatidylglycerophosphatase A